MEAIHFSETSVHARSTRHHIPEDGILYSHCRENLKSYIGRLQLLKYTDDNLKAKTKDFGNISLSLKRINMSSHQLKIGENIITQPQGIVESFADHLSSIFNSPSSVVIPNNVRCTFSGL
jgi:hypothetical protein